MSANNKIWGSVILRSLGAILVGISFMAMFVALVSLYGAPQEDAIATTAQSLKFLSLKFPENEEALDALSARLAHEGTMLSTIEPAAGDKPPVQKN